MCADLQDDAGITVFAIIALDNPENIKRRRNRIRRTREDSHHRVTDRLDDRAGMLLDGRT